MSQNEILLTFFSVTILAFGLLNIERNKRLKRTGKKANAIIFKNNYEYKNGSGSYSHVVRFTTERGQWITQKLTLRSNLPIQEGKEIAVIYDPVLASYILSMAHHYNRGCCLWRYIR